MTDPRIEVVYQILKNTESYTFESLAERIVAALPEPETLGWAVAYPKADYWRVFAGYMGGLEPTAEEMRAEAIDAGDWNDLCRVVRVVADQ